jgi:hypothetical protein
MLPYPSGLIRNAVALRFAALPEQAAMFIRQACESCAAKSSVWGEVCSCGLWRMSRTDLAQSLEAWAERSWLLDAESRVRTSSSLSVPDADMYAMWP